MNKGLTITLIILLSIFTLLLSAVLVVLVKKDFKFSQFSFGEKISSTLVDEKEITNIKDINVETDVADIKVEPRDISNIKVELYSDNVKEHEITEEENDIKVVLKSEKRNSFGFGRTAPYIKIYVPKTYDKNLDVNSRVGDIKVGDLESATLKVKSDVGDVKVENILDVTIKTRVGDIKIEKINNYLSLNTKTGDIKIGNASIKKNSKIKTNVGDIRINKTNGCYIDATSNVGDKSINQNDRKSDIVLEIKSNVGDIDIN